MFRSTLICLAVALAGLVSVVACATSAARHQPQGKIMHWTIDGVRREALVFAPRANYGSANHPLVLAFHGHGGQMLSTSVLMQIQTLWPEAIVVYPQGLNTPTIHEPAGTMPGWQGKAGESGDRDLRLFDAIGEVAGRLDPSEALTLPRPFLAIAGRSDAVAPFAVQKQTIQQARQVNRAFGRGSRCGRHCTYYPWPFAVKVFLHPGGHVYPVWASAEIVKVFTTHRLGEGLVFNSTRGLVVPAARRLPLPATP